MKLLGALAAGLIVAGAALPAHAGSWSFTITGSSSRGGLSAGPPNYTPPSGSTVNGASTSYSTSGGFTSNGTVTLTLSIKAKWVPDPTKASDPAPPTQGLLEQVSVTSEGYGQSGTTATANDGLGEVTSYTVPTPWTGAPSAMTTASGKHLTQASNGTFSVTRTLVASISGSGSMAPASFQYSIALDPRTVTLSRNNLDWIDSNGAVNGNTTFSFNDPTWNSYNWQAVTATLGGRWSTYYGLPNINYAWSPDESDDTYDTGNWEVMLGSLAINPDGSVFGTPDTPTTKTIAYTATDLGDGAKASASYIFHVHDPFDNLRVDPNACYAPTTTEYFYAHPPGQGYYCVGNVNGQTTNGTSSVAITGTAQGKVSFSGDMNLNILKALKPAIELQLAVSETVSVGTQVMNIPNGMEEFPEAIMTWPVYHDVIDEYSTAGFVQTDQSYYEDLSQAVTTLGWSKPVPIGSVDLPDLPAGN